MSNASRQGKYETAQSRWAGVGPYYAMFPTSFALGAVEQYTRPGDWILDPFAGRGTSLFAAASEGRFGLGIEINPVGWVYGKTKLQTADRLHVEERIRWLGRMSTRYEQKVDTLPVFFSHCFCRGVNRFLLAARDLLDWRRRKTDWTTMALLLVDLHGKRSAALSNQMRQTKAMAPNYAIRWWKERDLTPPDRDPVEFLIRKVAWRYAKGRMSSHRGRVYLGDSQPVLDRVLRRTPKSRVKLLLTSPPYYGITNYFYDQWLRLWLLGGLNQPRSVGDHTSVSSRTR